MKEIKEFIQKQGWKYVGKSATEQDMFEKGNSVIYISKITFPKQKEETFEEITAKMNK